MFYDQLCSANGPYLKYLVYGCKVKMRLINESGDTT